MDSVGRKAEFGLSRFFKAAVFVFCCMALLLIGTCSAFAAPPNKNADTAKTQAQKKKEAKIDKELEAKRKAVMQTVQADIKKNAYDKASIHLEDALARDPKWKEGLKLLGNIYVSHFKHYKNAAETYRTYLYYYPNDEKIKREYGRCLISSNDFEAAEEVWKSIFQKDANDAEAVYNLAEIAYSQNSLKDAMHMADDACMLKDDYYEAMYLQLKIYVR